MASEGTASIGGKQYQWTSPTIKDIMGFEAATKLLLIDERCFNSARGRSYLAELCLRKHHPEITAGVILGWPAADLLEIWEMISEAIPIFTVSRGPKSPPARQPADEAGGSDEAPAGNGQTSTSQPAPSSSGGGSPTPGASEY